MPTALYRHFATDGTLLYVGVAANPVARLYLHERQAEWIRSIATVTVEWFETKVAALCAEKTAVRVEKPKYNRYLKNLPRTPSGEFDKKAHMRRIHHLGAEVRWAESRAKRMPAEQAKDIWFNHSIDVRTAISMMPGWSTGTAYRLLGRRTVPARQFLEQG